MMKIDLLGIKRMLNILNEREDDSKLVQGKIYIDPVYKLCRHPMQAGFIGLFLFSSCNYNLGRTLFIILMITGILIGVNEEEKNLAQDKYYRKISKIVRNKFIPNFMNLFSNEFKELEEELKTE